MASSSAALSVARASSAPGGQGPSRNPRAVAIDATIPGSGCSICVDLKTDVEHLTGDRAAWEKQYELALAARGYAKDACTSSSCTFTSAADKINVNVNQVASGKKPKTIVHLARTPAKR